MGPSKNHFLHIHYYKRMLPKLLEFQNSADLVEIDKFETALESASYMDRLLRSNSNERSKN